MQSIASQYIRLFLTRVLTLYHGVLRRFRGGERGGGRANRGKGKRELLLPFFANRVPRPPNRKRDAEIQRTWRLRHKDSRRRVVRHHVYAPGRKNIGAARRRTHNLVIKKLAGSRRSPAYGRHKLRCVRSRLGRCNILEWSGRMVGSARTPL